MYVADGEVNAYDLETYETQTPQQQPVNKGSGKPKFRVFTALDALQPLPAITWLVDGLVADGSLTLLVGEPGSKKTFSMLSLAVCVASGQDWVGKRTTQGKILFIDEESGYLRLLSRVKKILHGYQINGDIPISMVTLAGFNLRDKTSLQDLRTLIGQEKPKLVIIDSLAAVMPGADENSVKDVQPVFTALRKIIEEYKTAVIVVHHTNKSGGYRGSSAMKGAVDTLLTIESRNDSQVIRLRTEKVRDGEPFEFEVIANFQENTFSLAVYNQPSGTEQLKPVEFFIIDFLTNSGPSSTKRIVEAGSSAGYNPQYVRQSINSPSLKGIVSRVDNGFRGRMGIYAVSS